MENIFFVSLDIDEAADKIFRTVVDGTFSGELLDHYRIESQAGEVQVLLFEKYYYRVRNRMTLTVTLDNMSGRTRVHSASGGGGNGLFSGFDRGASENFSSAAFDALYDHIIK